jgi:uncharacterized zinc-type alcohol dehydrogenase-like protein
LALTSDPEVMKSLAGEFDVILNTVLSRSWLLWVFKLLNTNVIWLECHLHSCNSCSLISFETQNYYGSLIGGIAETQEMLGYCAEHNIISDVSNQYGLY